MTQHADTLITHAHLFTMGGDGVGYIADGAIAVENVPAATAEPFDYGQQQTEGLVAKSFNGCIDRTWKISSFSSLTAYLSHGDVGKYQILSDVPDYDEGMGGQDVKGLFEPSFILNQNTTRFVGLTEPFVRVQGK